MAVPDPSPDAGRRRQRPGRCLLRVTIGGTISVLVTSATAILRTIPIRRSVIAPLFETAVNIVPTVLRRRSGSTADQQQGGGYKSRGWLHGSSEWLADCCFHRVNFCALSAFQTVRRRNRTVIRGGALTQRQAPLTASARMTTTSQVTTCQSGFWAGREQKIPRKFASLVSGERFELPTNGLQNRFYRFFQAPKVDMVFSATRI